MTINSASATNIEQGCVWSGDFYACLITYMINECQNNDACYGYDKNIMMSNHRDAAVGFCLEDLGECPTAAACEFFSSSQMVMVDNVIDYAMNYVFDEKNGVNPIEAQRAIEVEVMNTLISWGVCSCSWGNQYIYPSNSFGAGLVCAECPDGGSPIYNASNFSVGIETCVKYGDVPFSDSVGSGYQAGPCGYIPASSDWATYDR